MVIVGKKLNTESLKKYYDVIYVGSGLSALASAAFLSLMNKKVLILEQHYTLGGNTHSFKKKGFIWDAGVHYVGEVHNHKAPLRKVFDFLSKGQLKWDFIGERNETIIIDEKEYVLKSGEKAFIEELSLQFPQEKENLITYIKLVKDIFHSAPSHFLRRLFPSPFRQILKGKIGKSFYDYLNKSTQEVMDSFFKDEKLKAVLTSFYGDYGLPPNESPFSVHAIVAGHYLDGSSYPQGGSHAIAATIMETIESQGGQAFTRAKVKHILIKNNQAYGVELDDGTQVYSKKVVSSCGLQATLKKLLPQSQDRNEKVESFKTEILRLKPSPGFFSLYIGLKEEIDPKDLPIENYWIHPSSDLNGNWIKEKIPFLFVSFPSKRDSLSQGQNIISLLSPMGLDEVAAWENTQKKQRPEEYDSFKKDYEEACLEILLKQFPFLEGKIEQIVSGTPLTNRHYTATLKGEPYGLAPTKERFLCEELTPKSVIKGLYFTGVDLTIAGVAPSLSSGILTTLKMHPFRMIHLLSKIFN